VAALLTELQLHPEAFLVVRGDEILTRDVRLREDDEVELLPVISGGGTP
jgi:sulfur carrier protein